MFVNQSWSGLKSSDSKASVKGFSLSSSSTQLKSKKLNCSSSSRRRAQTSFVQNEDSDSDVGLEQNFHVEAISGFGENGALKDVNLKSDLLVIEKLENKDWKSELRRKRNEKNILSTKVKARLPEPKNGKVLSKEDRKEGVDVVNSNDNEVQWGLSVRRRTETEVAARMEDKKITRTCSDKTKDDAEHIIQKSKTLDEEALEALLGQDERNQVSSLVIPAETPTQRPEAILEHNAYKSAIASAPDPSTLEDYERVPVEEFGTALLRGMGWNGEKVGGMKEVKRRQNLLGLGAKELKEAEELGAWVNKSDIKRLKSCSDQRAIRANSRPKAADYNREKENRRRQREERSGGSYRRDRTL